MLKIIKKVFNFIKKIPKKYIVGIIILLVLGRIFIFKPPKVNPLQFATVKRGDVKSTVSASGTLTGKESSSLRFVSGGRLAYIGVGTGEIVKKGQLVGSLDQVILSSNLQQAKNTLRDKQATVQNILDQVKGHDNDETPAQKALRTSAEVARDSATDAVRAAQDALRNANLYSPIDGVVVAQDTIQVGQNVSPTDLIAQIVNFSDKEFWADIDEADISKVSLGQATETTLNAYVDKIFKGHVIYVSPQAKTVTSGATVITVKIVFDDPGVNAINGLNGETSIIYAQSNNTSFIPQEALVNDSEVYVKSGTGTEKRIVKTGIKSDTDVQILSGLSDGDEVVTNPEKIQK